MLERLISRNHLKHYVENVYMNQLLLDSSKGTTELDVAVVMDLIIDLELILLIIVNLLGLAVTLKTEIRPWQWLKASNSDASSWLLARLFRGSFVSIKDLDKEDSLLADIITILLQEMD
ncbi:hypothetical protein OUZ56_029259 [Daphnia magna]|uniref:Uncharacterized protein n=1 Tax=Daphnia magna TaxID=35525 RepID=A0ABR0B6B7_9CRUS|nr:hypothetical protein OUZ56_029259 [Daphnia magna]